MSNNSFRPRKFEDFEIVDANMDVVGHIRVKPSGILWAPKHSKVWYGLSQQKFAELAEEHGNRQKKQWRVPASLIHAVSLKFRAQAVSRSSRPAGGSGLLAEPAAVPPMALAARPTWLTLSHQLL